MVLVCGEWVYKRGRMIERYLVSPEIAKRMGKLGWKKEVIFCWMKLKSEKEPILCYHNLKNDEQFYTVEDLLLIDLWDVGSWCYAPLAAEIWEEMPTKVFWDSMEKADLIMQKFADGLYNVVMDEYDMEKCGSTSVEALGEMWCWGVEKGHWGKNEK